MHFNLIWVFLEKFGASLLSVGMFFIYAYFLDPRDMGVAVIILSITQFLAAVINTLFEDAMVQIDKLTKSHISTAFTASVSIALISMAAVLCGFLYLDINTESYNTRALVSIASLEIILTNLGVVYVAQLRRSGGFKVLAIRVLVGRIGGALCGLFAILYGMGAWAIVLQSVIGSALQTVILIGAVKKVPPINFDIQTFKYYLKFGSLLALKRVQWDAMVRCTPIIAGATLGNAAAGHIGFAWRIVELFRSAVVSGLMNYLLPHFSRLQNSKEKMGKEFVSATSIIAFFVTPLFLGIVATAPLIITTIFAAKWHAAIPLVQIYCISALIGCYRVPAGVSIIASGTPGKMLIEGFIVILISACMMYAFGHHGLWVFAAIFVFNATILLPIGMRIIRNLLSLSAKQQISPVIFFSIPGVYMAFTLSLSQNIFANHPVIDTAFFQVPLGVIIFTAIALVFYRKQLTKWYAGLTKRQDT